MHFNTLSISLLGLAALAVAAPAPEQPNELEARLPAQFSERGLTWSPRKLKARANGNNNNNNNNNNNDITITETETVQLTESQKSQEAQLTVIVEKKIKIDNGKKKAQDNVRKNHYKNKNSGKNTVIVVVTEIVDIRDATKQNTRYMSRQVKAQGNNDNNNDDIVVVVTEIKKITIDGSNNNGKNGQGSAKTQNADQQASATAAALSSIQTYDPSAPFAASNETQILPSGAAAPNWGQQVDTDPAIILEEDQAAFVDFAQQS